MPTIQVTIDPPEPPWADLDGRGGVDLVGDETVWQLVTLRDGMRSGKASVGLRLDLPGGRTVIAQTSVTAFLAAAAAVRGAHGEDGDR